MNGVRKISLIRKFALLSIPLFAVATATSVFTWTLLRTNGGGLEKAVRAKELAFESRIQVGVMSDAIKSYMLDPTQDSELKRKKSADDKNVAVIEELGRIVESAEIQTLAAEMGEFDEQELNVSEDKVLELLRAGKTAEANEYFSKTYLPNRAKYDALSVKLLELVSNDATRKIRETQATTRQAALQIIGFLMIGVSCAIGLFLWVAFGLSKKLSHLAVVLAKSSDGIFEGSNSLAESSDQVASGATTTASALEETVASLEELTSIVKLNAANAHEAARLAKASDEAADAGESRIAKLNVSMTEIAETSKKIEEITGVIDDIAFQTNLLALNAAVEAARAGEQGKGFAVVAEAVRALAQKSGTAAHDISALISGSAAKIHEGKKQVEESSHTFSEIVSSIRKVSQLNTEISSASLEQSTGLEQIGRAMNDLDRASQSNASAAATAAEATRRMSAEADVLLSFTRDLTVMVEGGVSDITPETQAPVIKAEFGKVTSPSAKGANLKKTGSFDGF